MCGIAGLWHDDTLQPADAQKGVERMTHAIRHRGPDAEGFWSDDAVNIAFGHRRLAILDLTEQGSQPMISPSGRYVVAYNGEIYNHLELRRDFLARAPETTWRGASDTETLVAAIDLLGVEPTLERLCGMFAFAVWDRRDRHLYLARDRMGEKPLYYGRCGRCFLFASELKAITQAPDFDCRLDPAALSGFLRYGYVPEPLSIYAAFSKVPAGSLVRLREVGGPAETRCYWSLEDVALAAPPNRRRYCGDSPAALARRTEQTLLDVVESQMLSDVPLGSFLSGGIDSSLVTALMQRVSDQPVRTFSIGFDDPRFNESGHARAVASHLGTVHTEFEVTESDALDLVPKLPEIYDEPFADSSQLPTVLLCRLARQQVTVALTGDGGDEVFGGYNRHLFARLASRYILGLPKPVRSQLARVARQVHRVGYRETSWIRRIAGRADLPVTAVDKAVKLGNAVGSNDSLCGLYLSLISAFDDPNSVTIAPQKLPMSQLRAEADRWLSPGEWMMAMDSVHYLPGDILVKVDRAAMHSSLETRAPFLDRRVVELAWQLPPNARIGKRRGKRILHKILFDLVPRELLERPKQGFAVPLDRWLRGNLREWASHALSPASLSAVGYLDPDEVDNIWQEHLTGSANHGQKIWALLMLVTWLQTSTGSRDSGRHRQAVA